MGHQFVRFEDPSGNLLATEAMKSSATATSFSSTKNIG
jgi:hypothetical protein